MKFAERTYLQEVFLKTFRTLELAIEFYGMVEEAKIAGHLREQLLRAASL